MSANMDRPSFSRGYQAYQDHLVLSAAEEITGFVGVVRDLHTNKPLFRGELLHNDPDEAKQEVLRYASNLLEKSVDVTWVPYGYSPHVMEVAVRRGISIHKAQELNDIAELGGFRI